MRMRTGKAIQLLRKPNCCANARVPPVAEVPAGSAVLPGSCRCGLLRKSTYRDTDGDCFASRDIGSTASQERESACSLRKVLVDARAAARVIGPSLLDVRGISDPARRALAGGPSAASPTMFKSFPGLKRQSDRERLLPSCSLGSLQLLRNFCGPRFLASKRL
jgi:hypothetical protein